MTEIFTGLLEKNLMKESSSFVCEAVMSALVYIETAEKAEGRSGVLADL